MSAPQVSIIIGAFNVASYIETALHSALQQAGVSCEVIVVDDASTDNTSEIVARHVDSRLQLIQLPHNQGPGAARNAGIARASGEWIAILDGDDAFEPGRLARLINVAQAQAAQAVIDNPAVLNEAQGTVAPMFPPALFAKLQTLDLPTLMRGSLSGGKGFPLACVKPIFATNFLKAHDISYHSGIRIGEDYLFLAESLASGARCAVDPNCGYRYTRRAGSISHRIPAENWRVMIEFEQQFVTKYTLSDAARKAQQARFEFMNEMRIYETAVEALKRKDGIAALKAISQCPAALLRFSEPLMNRVKSLYDKTRLHPAPSRS